MWGTTKIQPHKNYGSPASILKGVFPQVDSSTANVNPKLFAPIN